MILVQEVKILCGSISSKGCVVRNEKGCTELKVVVKVSEQESSDKRWIKELISWSHDFELLSESLSEISQELIFILYKSLAYHKTRCNVQYGMD